MMTINGLRRRGFTPEAINDFVDRVGVSRSDQHIKYDLLEYCLRVDLDTKAPRVMAVLDPIKVTLSNWPGTLCLLSSFHFLMSFVHILLFICGDDLIS